MEVIKEALTFDDVLLVPQYSSILPSETNLHTDLGSNLKLKIPCFLEERVWVCQKMYMKMPIKD